LVDGSAQRPSDALANGSAELCVVVASESHALVPGTGNCMSLEGLTF
jgi:hypothetical protein